MEWSPEGGRETLLLMVGSWYAEHAGQETIPQAEQESHGELSLPVGSRMLSDISSTASTVPLRLPQFPHFI